MYKMFLSLGAIFAALSVALGAFGAHGLKKIVPAESVATFQTGVQYQFYHAIGLFLAGILFSQFPGQWMVRSGYCFLIGIILFSGSLYLLTFLHDTESVGLRRLGIITPFGGLFFIAGWLMMLMAIMSKK
jgi:uncharacterized membrane protein YgdD (TMEM256/DUF423 family)